MALAGIVAADTTSISASVTGTTPSITITPPTNFGSYALWNLNPGANSADLGAFTVTSNDASPGWQITATATNSGHFVANDGHSHIYTLADPVVLQCPTSGYNYWGSGGNGAADAGNLEPLTSQVTVAQGVAAGTFSPGPDVSLHQYVESSDVSTTGYSIDIEFLAVP
jgi:hypothetical protein